MRETMQMLHYPRLVSLLSKNFKVQVKDEPREDKQQSVRYLNVSRLRTTHIV